MCSAPLKSTTSAHTRTVTVEIIMEYLVSAATHFVSQKSVKLQISVIYSRTSKVVNIESTIVINVDEGVPVVGSVGVLNGISVNLSSKSIFLPLINRFSHRFVIHFLISLSQKIDSLSFILSCCVVCFLWEPALFVEGLFGRIFSIRVVIQRTEQFFDIHFRKILNIVAGSHMIAQIHDIFRLNIVLFISLCTSLQKSA